MISQDLDAMKANLGHVTMAAVERGGRSLRFAGEALLPPGKKLSASEELRAERQSSTFSKSFGQRYPIWRRAVSLQMALVVLLTAWPDVSVAQPFTKFQERSRQDMERYVERADRTTDVNAWNNYVAAGVATERIEWENEALDQVDKQIKLIESTEEPDGEKTTQIQALLADLDAARASWSFDAQKYVEEERGEFRAKNSAVSVLEVARQTYETLLAQAEVLVAGLATLDLNAWEAAVSGGHAAIKTEFETELASELARARSENAALTGSELAAFEQELARVEAQVRRDFEIRDSFYMVRGRNRYVAIKSADSASARLESDKESANAIGQQVLEQTQYELQESTKNMFLEAEKEIEALLSGEQNTDVGSGGTNWEARMEAIISAGLKKWQAAEEDLYTARLAWEAENKSTRAQGEKIWEENYKRLKESRDGWLGEIQKQILDGRTQWEAKIAEMRESRAAAEAELADYIQKERERWDSVSGELSSVINGGGSALLETKDALRYYNQLLAVLPADGSARDTELRAFYTQQRDFMAQALVRFQTILGRTEGVLQENMHSDEDHTGFLKDVRIFAGDLPEQIGELGEDDETAEGFETELRELMGEEFEDFVLYRRDLESLIDRNALFVERSGLLSNSTDFPYPSAATLAQLKELIDGLDGKFAEHRAALLTIYNKDRGSLDDDARLAAIKLETQTLLGLGRDARLKSETLSYFRSGLDGLDKSYYTTDQDGDPYLMTQAEYAWELLRRERNYLVERLRRAEAVKRYADLAFAHEAGLEMAAVTEERADIALVYSQLREISFKLIKGDYTLDAGVATDEGIRELELARLMSEYGLEESALFAREGQLVAERGILDAIAGAGSAGVAELNQFINDIDGYLAQYFPDEAAKVSHPLWVVRGKLQAYRDRLEAGASTEELDHRWTILAGGAGALSAEIGSIQAEYDFGGLRTLLTTLEDQVGGLSLTDLRGSVAEVKSRIEANAIELEQAREELEQAKEAYRQARIDFDIIKAGNSHDLIRIDLVNTTTALAGVLNKLQSIEDIDGIDTAPRDIVDRERTLYFYEIKQRELATSDFAVAEEAYTIVSALDGARKRAAALEGLITENPGDVLAGDDVLALAAYFISAKTNLIVNGAVESLNSGPAAIQNMQLLEFLHAGHPAKVTALADAGALDPPDKAAVETARAEVEKSLELMRRGVEALVLAIREEERLRIMAYHDYMGTLDGSGEPLVDVRQEKTLSDERKEALSSSSYELAQEAAEFLAEFLETEHRQGSDYRSFGELLGLLNDRIEALPRALLLAPDSAEDAGRAKHEMVRNWLIANRSVIEYALKAPDSVDGRSPEERWEAVLEAVAGFADDAQAYREFQDSLPDSSTHAWVVSHRDGLNEQIDLVLDILAGTDASLVGAVALLPSAAKNQLGRYGVDLNLAVPSDLRLSLEATLQNMRLELARLDVGYKDVYATHRAIQAGEILKEKSDLLAKKNQQMETLIRERFAAEEYRTELEAQKAALIAGGGSAVQIAALDEQIADLDALVTSLEGRISDGKPELALLRAEVRQATAIYNEAEQAGSTAAFFQAALGEHYLKNQTFQMSSLVVSQLESRRAQEKLVASGPSALDRVKATLGFYETDHRGEIKYSLVGDVRVPVVSAEFVALGITDPEADLAAILSGEQNGKNLTLWANRLQKTVNDPQKRESLPAEVLAAMDLVEHQLRETLAARAIILNRNTSAQDLRSLALADQGRAEALLMKLGLVHELEERFEAAIVAAFEAGSNPARAALAVLETADSQRILALFRGYDRDGQADGIADATIQGRMDDLIRTAAELRGIVLSQAVSESALQYASLSAQFVQVVKEGYLAAPVTPEEYLEAQSIFKVSDLATLVNGLSADGLRSSLTGLLAAQPPERGLYVSQIHGVLASGDLDGEDLRAAVLAALSNTRSSIEESFLTLAATTQDRAIRDADLVVDESVLAFMTAYAGRTQTAQDALAGLAAMDSGLDLPTARSQVLGWLETLNSGENKGALATIRRKVAVLAHEADSTLTLKSTILDYLNALPVSDAAEDLARLKDDLYRSSLLSAMDRLDLSAQYKAEDYPAELREILLLRAYQSAEKRYAEYRSLRDADTAVLRERAVLDLRGVNGAIAGSILLRDFFEYQSAHSFSDYLAAQNAADEPATQADYIQAYLKDRNTEATFLPDGGFILLETLAHQEYHRLNADLPLNGGIREEDYSLEMRDRIWVQKILHWKNANSVSISGATYEERLADFRETFAGFLSDPAYALDGKTMGQRFITKADRDRLLGLGFGLIEQDPPLDAYLPAALADLHSAGKLGDAVVTELDLLPSELKAIPDYATKDYRALAGLVGDVTFATLAFVDAAEFSDRELRLELDLSRQLADERLGQILIRAGYNALPGELETELKAMLKNRISAQFYQSPDAESALQVLRQLRAIGAVYTDSAAQKELEIFQAREGETPARMEEHFFALLEKQSAGLRTAAKEERGAFLKGLIERAGGQPSAYYDTMLPAELRLEFDQMATAFSLADGLDTAQKARLSADIEGYARFFQARSNQELVVSGIYEGLEGALAGILYRSSDLAHRALLQTHRNQLVFAFADLVGIAESGSGSLSASAEAFFGAHAGLKDLLLEESVNLDANFREVVAQEQHLLLRLGGELLESDAERLELEALFLDPRLLDPFADLSLSYEAQKNLAILKKTEKDVSQALLGIIGDNARSLELAKNQYEEEAYVAKRLLEFAALRGQDAELRDSRFSNYRTYIGAEGQYFSDPDKANLQEEGMWLAVEKQPGLTLAPEAILAGDFETILKSDRSNNVIETTNANGDAVQRRILYGVSSTAEREGADPAEMRHTFYENLANNYLEAITNLNRALAAVFLAADMADDRKEKELTEVKAKAAALYDLESTDNNLADIEALKVDAQSRLAIHNQAKIEEKQGAIAQAQAVVREAGETFAAAGRRKQLSSMDLKAFLEVTFQGVAAQYQAAEAQYNLYANIADDLRTEYAEKATELASGLAEYAQRYNSLAAATDRYEERQHVAEYARTPYLFTSLSDAEGGKEFEKTLEEYRGDAATEYERALAAVNLIQQRLDEASFQVLSQDRLEDFNAVVEAVEQGTALPALNTTETTRLLELRERKNRQHETLNAAEEAELQELTLRLLHSEYGELILARAESIKHTARMIRVHKASEIVSAEIMRRRLVAEEKQKQFDQILAQKFGTAPNETIEDARNAVYLRMAGMVEGGGSFFNEFRGWYFGQNQWASDAYSTYHGSILNTAAGMGQAMVLKFWPTQIIETAVGMVMANSIPLVDQQAIGLWMAAGNTVAEYASFKGVYFSALALMGVMDQKKLKVDITYTAYGGPAAQNCGSGFFVNPFCLIAKAFARKKIAQAEMEYRIATLSTLITYSNARDTASGASAQAVMGPQREAEDAWAALYYFTRIKDQQTLKERLIEYGRQRQDDDSAEALYQLSEEDLVYLFEMVNGNLESLRADGSNNNPDAAVRSEALDITGIKETVEYKDAFGRHYDPESLIDGQPGPLAGGAYLAGDGSQYTRIKFFRHDGSTYYRYARLIPKGTTPADQYAYDMSKVLDAAVAHGQAIRDQRLAAYMQAGNLVAQAAGDTKLILEDRDQTFEELFNAAAGHREGGREFTGYRMTYQDYLANSSQVVLGELEQRIAVQQTDWELKERELLDKIASWEGRVNTILERGRKNWSGAEDRFLAEWRKWRKDFDEKEEEARAAWDVKIADHFKAKEAWETGIRQNASEETIERVLSEAVLSLNAQMQNFGKQHGVALPAIDLQSTINKAVETMKRDMPAAAERLTEINKDIVNFKTHFALSEMVGADLLSGALSVAGDFQAEMNEHAKRMKVLSNVKIFEEYRKMQVEFKKSIQVQNESVDQSTAASAMAAGYMRQGSRFVKQAHGTASFGAVDAYSYFDADHHLDQALRESGFADKSGEDLVRFLEHASDVEVETYFYTQKLALQAAFETILGRGGEKGQFANWVGEGPDGQGAQLATVAAGNSFSSNMFERGLALDMASGGSGELGSQGARPGGAPAGFYVQLKWMDGWVQQEQQRHMTAVIGTTNPIETLFNQFNPIMMIGNANYNIQMKSTFEGYDKNQMIVGEIGKMFHGMLSTTVAVGTSVLTNSLMALGGAFGGPGGAFTGAAIGVGVAVVANTIVDGFEIDERGRGSFSMNQEKWAGVLGKSLATMLPGGVIGATLGQAAISMAQSGFEYDEKGNQVGGWKMDAAKLDRLALETTVGAITHVAGGGLDGKSGGLAGALKVDGFTGRAINSGASSAIQVGAAYAEMQISGGATATAKYNAMNDVGMNRLGSLMASGYEWQTGAISGAAQSFARDAYKDDTYEWLVAGKSLGEKQVDALKQAGYSSQEIAWAQRAQENNNRHQAAQILLGAAYVNSRQTGYTPDGEPYTYDYENGWYVTASGMIVNPDGTPFYYAGPTGAPPKMAPPLGKAAGWVEKGLNFATGNGFKSDAEVEAIRQAAREHALAAHYVAQTFSEAKNQIEQAYPGPENALIREKLLRRLTEYQSIWKDSFGMGASEYPREYIRKLASTLSANGPHPIPEVSTPQQMFTDLLLAGRIESLISNGEVTRYEAKGNQFILYDENNKEIGRVVRGSVYKNQYQNQTNDQGVSGGNMCQITATSMLLEQYGISIHPDKIYTDWRSGTGAGKGFPSSNVTPILAFAAERYTKGNLVFQLAEAKDPDAGRLDANNIIKDWLQQGSIVQAATYLTPPDGHQITIIGYRTDRSGNQVWITNDPGGNMSAGGYNARSNGMFAEYRFDRPASGTSGAAIGSRRIYRLMR
ncbi:MAG: C39 family peptidase [Spirochaetales bacterium]|nr:C39 family peptidase [Spirochaetales bacterium]